MALAPSNAWYEAIGRADAQPRLLIELYDGANTWRAVNGSMSPDSDLHSSNVPVALIEASQLGVELDPLTRKSQIKAMEFTLLDAWIRPIATNYQLARQRVKIWLGAAELSETDFLAGFVGEIDGILPDKKDGFAIMTATDLISSLGRHFITGFWTAHHPLEALHHSANLDGILDKVGIQDFDEDTFDRTEPQYADIENAIISRAGKGELYSESNDKSISQPTSALELAAQVCETIYAHLDFTEDGDLRCVRYNSSSSNLDTWDDNVIRPGSFKQISSGADNIVNQVVWEFGDPLVTYQANETDSQSDYAYPGTTKRVETHKIKTGWLDDFSIVQEALDTTETAITIGLSGHVAMSGNRSDMSVDSDSPVYLLIRGSFPEDYDDENPQELVKSTSLTRDTAMSGTISVWDPSEGVAGEYVDYPASSLRGTFSSVTRNWPDGPPGKAHPVTFTFAYDATLPVIISDMILKRFKDGAPLVELDTGIDKFEFQIGDFIGIETDDYFIYDSDGLDGSEKWEITGKEVSADLQTIHWSLVLVTDDALTRGGRVDFMPHSRSRKDLLATGVEPLGQSYREQGLSVTQDAGLNGLIAAGAANNSTLYVANGKEQAHTFTASKDTYVSIDLTSGWLVFRELSNGAAAPSLGEHEVLLSKVVTDGAGITSTDDSDTPVKPIDGTKLIDETVGTNQIAGLAITNPKIGSKAVDTAELADSAVDTLQLAAEAVEEAKVATAAVTTVKVANYAIGVHNTVAETAGRNHGHDFNDWSRG